MFNLKKSLTTICAIFLTCAPASSATLLVESGELIGATDIDVNGTLFDVAFPGLNCVQAYNGCDEAEDFSFFNVDDARAAAIALFEQVLLDGPLGNFDSEPENTRGCDFGPICFVQFPWAAPVANGFSLGMVSAGNNPSIPSAGQNDLVTFGGLEFANTDSISRTIAVWSPASIPPTTAIPVPASALMLAFGLMALTRFRK